MTHLKTALAVSIFLTILGSAIPARPAGAGPSPRSLLERADRARGGLSGGLKWAIRLSSREGGETSDTGYNVEVKGLNVLARCESPPRKKDETYLFNDRNLWVYRPGLRKPISVSPRQRLSGQAANGDIATTNYARDYDGQLVGEEVIDGVPAYRLKLKARARDVTYDGITYWISKSRQLGIQAEFLTLEGKVFKRAKFEYANTISVGGGSEPFISKVVITDAAFPDNVTTIQYENPRPARIPDSEFNVNNLAR